MSNNRQLGTSARAFWQFVLGRDAADDLDSGTEGGGVSAILVNAPALPGPEWSGHNRPISYFDTYHISMTPSQYYSFPMEHLGLMAIKAYGATQGLEIETVNGLVDGHTSLEQTFAALKQTAHRSGPPSIVGFSNIATAQEVVTLARWSRAAWPDALLVMGNTFATLNHERVLTEYDVFDCAVIASGEVAFSRLAAHAEQGLRTFDVPGVAWRRDDGSIDYRPPGPVDIASLPWPSRTELPRVVAAGFAAAVYSTRGCPYRCTFCGTGAISQLLGPTSYAARDIVDVVDEIEHLVKDHDVEFFVITDDLFVTKHPSSRRRALHFADELSRRRLSVRFMLDARVDSLDREVFAALRRAGLRRVFVGLETGSQQTLHGYGKRYGFRDTTITERLDMLKDLDIEVIPGVMMFHPSVEPDELRATLEILLATDYQSANPLYDHVTPYPGTPLYAEYKDRGLLTVDWPLGEWEFQDPGARRTFEQIRTLVTENPAIPLAEARPHFERLVDEWEAERHCHVP